MKERAWKKIFRIDDDLRVEAGARLNSVCHAALGCNVAGGYLR